MTRLLIAAAFLGLSGAAIAQQPEIVVYGDYMKMGWGKVTGDVKFGDLDLKTDAGVATLNSRVEAEGKRICAAGSSANERSTCMASVKASAAPQVDRVVAMARGR